MVPRGEKDRQENGKGTSRQRETKGRGKPRSRAKKKGPSSQPQPLIDPDYAVMIRVPIRTSIVALGHQRLISPVEFAEAHGYELHYISDQFKALVKANLLESVENVRVRGTVKHMYRSTKRAFVTNPDWSQFGKSIREGMSGAIIQDLNGQVARSMEAGTLDARENRCLFWECMTADEISWKESEKILAWAVEALKEEAVKAANRRANGESEECFPATFAILGFESPTESALKKARAKAKSRAAKRKPAKGKGRGGKK